MKLTFERFGGIIPGTDPVNLPQNAAQIAKNVDLSEGTLKPWSITNPFVPYDFTGELVAGDVAAPSPAPAAVTLNSYQNLVPSYSGLFTSISAKSFVYDRTSDTSTEPTSTISINSISETSTGFILHCTMNQDWYKPMLRGDTYEVVGPLYQFSTANQFSMGTNFTVPTVILPGGAQAPSFSVPLYSAANSQVGTLQLVDVNGPNFSGEFTYPGEEGTVTRQTLGGKVDFHFDCNFIRGVTQSFYYIQQQIGTGAVAGRDGPASPVSARIEIPPGKRAVLNTVSGGNLYRSGSSQSGFGLIEEGTGTTFVEDLRDAAFEELPPNGSIGSISTANSIIHPAGFALFIDGADLRPSSEWIDAPRYWAVPPEYAYTFDSTIECIALSGGTILVFTQTAVYRVHGQHPSRLTVYKISDKPIAVKTSLWQDDTTIGWCNKEGIVLYDGGSGQLVTGEYMRADVWNALYPELDDDTPGIVAKVNDRTVCIESATTKLRFDFRGDRSAAISTYTVSDGSAALEWKSKRFTMPKPMGWYACRINSSTATTSVTLKLYGDGVEVVNQTVATNEEVLLPRTVKAKEWEVYVSAAGEVRSVEIATNRREL